MMKTYLIWLCCISGGLCQNYNNENSVKNKTATEISCPNKTESGVHIKLDVDAIYNSTGNFACPLNESLFYENGTRTIDTKTQCLSNASWSRQAEVQCRRAFYFSTKCFWNFNSSGVCFLKFVNTNIFTEGSFNAELQNKDLKLKYWNESDEYVFVTIKDQVTKDDQKNHSFVFLITANASLVLNFEILVEDNSHNARAMSIIASNSVATAFAIIFGIALILLMVIAVYRKKNFFIQSKEKDDKPFKKQAENLYVNHETVKKQDLAQKKMNQELKPKEEAVNSNSHHEEDYEEVLVSVDGHNRFVEENPESVEDEYVTMQARM